jgi:hypothetical protein
VISKVVLRSPAEAWLFFSYHRGSSMTAQQIVDLLNSICENDPQVAHDLVERRFPVTNQKWFNDHPTLVVDWQSGNFGLLGLLHGITAFDGDVIEAVFDDKTQRVVNFQLRRKPVDAYADAAI